MKLWIDDIRPAPEGYVWVKSTNRVNSYLGMYKCIGSLSIDQKVIIELIDLDHDAGEYAKDGGDYIKILDFMEENKINNVPIHIHSHNPVGVINMRRIIKRNGWKEV